jgi:phage gpG-like protein
VRIVLDISGDVQLDRTLLRFADRTDDMSVVFGPLADDFLRMERSQFSSQGRFSAGWAPLSPDYAARKARKYPGAKILHATGDLEASLTRRGARNAVRQITSDSLLVGSTDPKVAYHQFGTENMPRRRPVEMSASRRRRWVRAIQRYYTTGQVKV